MEENGQDYANHRSRSSSTHQSSVVRRRAAAVEDASTGTTSSAVVGRGGGDAPRDEDVGVVKKYYAVKPKHRPEAKNQRSRNKEVVAVVASLVVVFLLLWRLDTPVDDGADDSPPTRKVISHATISAGRAVPIVFSSLIGYDKNDDLNGRFSYPDPLNDDAQKDSKEPDWGRLKINLFLYDDDRSGSVQRSIYHDHREYWSYEKLKKQEWDPVTEEEVDPYEEDWYYALDDDVERNPLHAYDDDNIQNEKRCRRTNWHRDLHINCNTLHEFDVPRRFRTGEASFLGRGSYRHSYLSKSLDDETVVFKSYRYHDSHKTEDFEYMRIDAQIAEIFTWSPRLVGVHAFCGHSMINEPVMGGRMEAIALPFDHYEDDDDADEHYAHMLRVIEAMEKRGELVVLNDLTGTEKLLYALEMAEPLLLLHSYPGGVIVHDDLTLEQYLVAEDGTVKLNDLNRGEVMLFNEEDQEYCRYRNGAGNGYWRSPEEYKDEPLNEKIDIFSLGNNFYALLTGLPPFAKLDDDIDAVKNHIMDGDTSFIDPRFRDRSFGERVLSELIPLCWKYNPDERIDIFELVSRLREAVEKDRQHVVTERRNLRHILTTTFHMGRKDQSVGQS